MKFKNYRTVKNDGSSVARMPNYKTAHLAKHECAGANYVYDQLRPFCIRYCLSVSTAGSDTGSNSSVDRCSLLILL